MANSFVSLSAVEGTYHIHDWWIVKSLDAIDGTEVYFFPLEVWGLLLMSNT